MSKVKVLYQSSIPHTKMGGQKSLLALIDNLDRAKYEPEVIVPEEGDLSNELIKRGLKFHIFRVPPFKPNKIINLFNAYFKMNKLLRSGNYQIVHSDHDKFMLFVSFIKGKFSTVYHARVVHSHKYDKYLNRRMNRIIVISKGVSKRFKNTLASNLKIIFNGVDCQVFRPISNRSEQKKELGVDANSFTVLFVGQMKEGKGIFELLSAANILRDNNYEFVFLGDFIKNEVREEWENQINELGLTNVKWLGQKKDIYKWMQCSDLLILPSHEGIEGMGRVLFESMACGTPVIATDTSGVNEAVTDKTGILVAEKSPEDIANAIKTISENKMMWNNMSSEGRKRAIEVFDIKVHAKNVMELYERLIDEKN